MSSQATGSGPAQSTTSAYDKNCTLLVSYDTTLHKESDYQRALESRDEEEKILGLKSLIYSVTQGEQYPRLLMSVIKYCLHSENHVIKKLLLLYWEVVEKKGPDGILLHEMILVCNAMKNNLTHPNEYIRGSTLRFLTHIHEEQILESLIPSITANLEHRHSYVRKNAILTVYTVWSQHPDLIPDAPELIDTFLYAESNPSAKRNAFLMLYLADQEKALIYLNTVLSTLTTMSESFQLVVLELIRKTVKNNPSVKGQYLKAIYHIIQNNTAPAVQFEGSNTLVALSSAPTAVRQAIQAYCTLLQNESDSNIKLIILQRLSNLRKRNEKILQDMIMDICTTLQAPNLEIRKNVLELATTLLSTRNVTDVVTLLKKELLKTDLQDFETTNSIKPDAYKKLIIEYLHTISMKFTSQIPHVVSLLLNYLADDNVQSSLDVIYFVREIVATNVSLRNELLTKLAENFNDIKSTDGIRVALWILSEYCIDPPILDLSLSTIRNSVGPLPLLLTPSTTATANGTDTIGVTDEESKQQEVKIDPSELAPKQVTQKKNPLILPDGTYASQSAVTVTPQVNGADGSSVVNKSSSLLGSQHSNLRALLLNGDWYLATTLANCITKLVMRFGVTAGSFHSPEVNNEITQTLLLCVSLLRLGTHKSAPKPIDTDSKERISTCIMILLNPSHYKHIVEESSDKIFLNLLETQKHIETADKSQREPKSKRNAGSPYGIGVGVDVDLSQPDDLIVIRQLKSKAGDDDMQLDDYDDNEDYLNNAATFTGGAEAAKVNDIATQLSRIHPLTGLNDPVYAEAQLIVHDYDIVLNITIVNQSDQLMANMSLELHTSGDLKMVDKPATYNLRAKSSLKLSVTIKMTSTESGIIFGNLTYDSAKGDKNIIVLNNIHMDVMDYIQPATVSDVAFRAMWAEFEWENKVAVNTEIQDLNAYLNHIISITNMNNLTPSQSISGDDCNFLAANLYARSMFGEDALLNLSIEKQVKSNKITGYIRIRSKTQGIALSLGDKITSSQRTLQRSVKA